MAVMTLQDIISHLRDFWSQRGCVLIEGYDQPVGAGTFHPATVFSSLGPDPCRVAYVQTCRRPTDGRYGQHQNRLGHYMQFQVLLKPVPEEPVPAQTLYLNSLEHLGIFPKQHDIRFIEDDWESPTLGAWGLGWEVWCDGMEISQFTYFQQMASVACEPVSVELTYGLERLAMYVQGRENIFDITYGPGVTYGDLFLKSEQMYSVYYFERADVDFHQRLFGACERTCQELIRQGLVFPAYEQCSQASHILNVLDARGVISVAQRQDYISRVRALAKLCGACYLSATSGGSCGHSGSVQAS